MKRYIIGLTLASALTMGLTSCSDFLEEPIRGQQDMENYFTTEEECEKQITGCYNFIACDAGGRFTNSTTSATLPPMIAGWVTLHRTRVNIE